MSGLGFKMGILMSRKISDLDSHTSGDETSKKCIKFGIFQSHVYYSRSNMLYKHAVNRASVDAPPISQEVCFSYALDTI